MGSVEINDTAGEEMFSIDGTAAFTISATSGFRMDSFRVNGFSLFGQLGVQAPGTSGVEDFDFFPTLDLAGDASAGVLTADTLNHNGYIDIQFNDLNGAGLNADTITDADPEFILLVAGVASDVY